MSCIPGPMFFPFVMSLCVAFGVGGVLGAVTMLGVIRDEKR